MVNGVEASEYRWVGSVRRRVKNVKLALLPQSTVDLLK